MLLQLQIHGINHIVVVLGYKEDYGRKVLKDISSSDPGKIIHVASNTRFEQTGTLKSLLLGVEQLPFEREGFLVIEGDVICEEGIIERIVQQEADTLAVDSSSVLDAESMKYVLEKKGTIRRISKDLPDDKSMGEFIGVSKFTRSGWTRFQEKAAKVDEEYPDAFYEEVIDRGKFHISALDIAPMQWTEVDFPAEYKKARQIFAKEEKLVVDYGLFDQSSHSPSVFSLTKDSDIEIHDFCFLANPFLLSEKMVEDLSVELKQLLVSYPPQQDQIAELVALFHEEVIAPNNILVGNGASELIKIINTHSTGSIVPIPTFSEYIEDIENLITYPLDEDSDFNLHVNDFISFCKNCSPAARTNVILINPNNPVGRLLKQDEVLRIVHELAAFTVVVDESFIEFSDVSQSILPFINDMPNVVVIKSYGKILGMPGIRLGALFAPLEIIETLKPKIPVWNINSIGYYILKQLSSPEFKSDLFRSCQKVKEETNNLFNDLQKIEHLKLFQPSGNFVFFKILDSITSPELRNLLLREKILVRDCSNKVGLSPKFLRIATRTRLENRNLVRHLDMLLSDLIKD